MKIALSRAMMVYDVVWKAPVFELAAVPVRTVQTLHALFGRRFRLTTADIQANNAAHLSEWAVRLSLYSGLWTVDFRFDGLTVTCNHLTNQGEIELAVECLRIAESVVREVVPSAVSQSVKAKAASWYRCEGGSGNASVHMVNFRPPVVTIAANFAGAVDAIFNLSGVASNPDERWAATFLVERSAVEGSDLFVQLETRYLEGGKFETLDSKRAHFGQLYGDIVKEAGLEFGEV